MVTYIYDGNIIVSKIVKRPLACGLVQFTRLLLSITKHCAIFNNYLFLEVNVQSQRTQQYFKAKKREALIFLRPKHK